MAEKRVSVRLSAEGGRAVRAEMEGIGTSGAKGFGQLSDEAQLANAKLASFARAAVVAGASILASFASLRTLSVGVTAARELDAALAETSTLIAGTADEMTFLKDSARAMSVEFGTSATAQVKAFYQAISAGAGSVQEAAGLLDVANKLAVGGVTDVTTAVDILTTATNVYSAEGLEAAAASDALFVAMKAGKTTITELSASLGTVLPLAQKLGVSFEETAAATAALTKGGIDTSKSLNGIRAAMTAVLKPSKEARDLANDLGINFSAAGIKAKGFAGFMADVAQKTNRSSERLAVLFGSVEATTVALSLSGAAGGFLTEILGQMGDKAGQTQTAFDKINDSLDGRLNRALTAMANIVLGLGDILLPVIVPALEGVASVLTLVSDNADVLAVSIGAMAAIAGGSALSSLGLMTVALWAASAAGTALGAAVAFLTGPVGLIVTAGLAVGALFKMAAGTDNFGAAADGAAAAQARMNDALGLYAQIGGPNARAEAVASTQAYLDSAVARLADAEATLAQARATENLMLLNQSSILRGELPESDLSLAIKNKTAESIAAVAKLKVEIDEARAKIKEIEDSDPAGPLSAAIPAANSLAGALGGAAGQASALSKFLSGLPGAMAGAESKIAGIRASIAALAGGGDAAAASVAKYRAELVASLPPLTSLQDGQRAFVQDSINQKVALFAQEQALAAEEQKRLAALNTVTTAAGSAGAAASAAAKEEEAAAKASADAWKKTADAIQRAKQQSLDAAQEVAQSITGPIKDALKAGEIRWRSFSDAVSSIAQNLASRLIDLAFKPIENALVSAFTGGGGGGLFSGLFGGLFGGGGGGGGTGAFGLPLPFARGGVFDGSGQVTAFARGGVVDRPTLFPFANGTGLMGEAGPEAILPLSRGPNGRLGVVAQGGGGPTVVRVELSPDLQARVITQARGETVQIVQAGINKYDRGKGRPQDPRRRD